MRTRESNGSAYFIPYRVADERGKHFMQSRNRKLLTNRKNVKLHLLCTVGAAATHYGYGLINREDFKDIFYVHCVKVERGRAKQKMKMKDLFVRREKKMNEKSNVTLRCPSIKFEYHSPPLAHR